MLGSIELQSRQSHIKSELILFISAGWNWRNYLLSATQYPHLLSEIFIHKIVIIVELDIYLKYIY